MVIFGLNGGHDGATAVIADRRLVLSFEAEKDSFRRHAPLTPTTLVQTIERVGEVPDVIALSGWYKGTESRNREGAGYFGHELQRRPARFFGKEGVFFSSSHERSHILTAVGMAPRDEAKLRAVLVWEGAVGSFYLLDERWTVVREVPVLFEPGTRYAFLYGLADPTFPDEGGFPRGDDSGKLMALAAYGDSSAADSDLRDTVDRILEAPRMWPAPKHEFRESPLHNAGLEAEVTKVAAALITERIFEVFAAAANEHLPAGIPLHISGGCGLNCDWNVSWRELGHFSSVFVPPCANDSGSAIGTALDALLTLTGDPYLEWDVYSGQEFEFDRDPNPARWERRPLDLPAIADSLAQGRVLAWVQGRAEIGPRALGNRSLLAEPFDPGMRDKLNGIKRREGFRPIAPCCRLEDAGACFDGDFEDPYMLYFRRTTRSDLGAVTHVDGTARCQTVTPDTNRRLHRLLSAFAEHTGVGVLCNTSLNFKGLGFINTTSDLIEFCAGNGIGDFVVGDAWFRHLRS
jgi:hydroxymethyl cephem carbamoyltransferase